MKKKLFNPSLLNQNHLPTMVSRRIFGSHRSGRFITAAYKSDAGGDEGGADDETALLDKIQQKVEAAVEGRATKEDIEQIRNEQKEALKGLSIEQLRSLLDDKNGVMAILARQGLEMQKLKNSVAAGGERALSIREQVAKWQKDNAENIERIRNGERGVSLPALNIRAVASPMTPATVNPGASPWIGRVEIEAGINPILREQPTFWDYLTKGRTNATTYGWVNHTVSEGEAAWLAPGELKPGISFSLEVETSNVKKIADSAKAATELLADIDGMATFIQQELRYAVMIKVNRTLLATGVASSTVPASIRSLSTTYPLAAGVINTVAPNHADVLRAVVAYMRSGLIEGDITIFINPIDSANMDMQKVSDGQYVLPPFMTADGKTIGGAKIVEDGGIPVGSFQAAFLRYYRILIYEDFNVSWGWENDDFTRNLVTAVGEMRMHQFFNSKYTGAFIYDTFARIKPLITTP